ncbi:MAG: aminotransferase class V-fold PLP-dependent enzyme, partial [Actinomycetota bacterium]
MRKPEIIMCPGPVKVSPEVLLAQSQPMVYHRGPGYGALLSAVTDGMKKIFKTSNDVLSFTCSGTGGMECAVANSFARGDEVLVVDVGNFGKRFFDIATGYGLKAVRMEYEWGKVAVPEEVAQTLAANPGVKGVLMQQSETSTGVMNDVQAIAKAIRGVSKDVLIIVDAISGLGAAELKTDEWDLDVVIAGSQKAMAMSPGLAFLAVSDRAWKANERSDLPKYYFSWKKTKDALSRPNPEHPFTPAVCLFQGMKTAIEIYLEEGSEAALA